MSETAPLPRLLAGWERARRRHGLTHLEVRQGIGLGLDPGRLGAIAGADGEAIAERIARLYEGAFGRERPGAVRTLEELADRLLLRKAAAPPARPDGSRPADAAGGAGRGRMVRLGVPVALGGLVRQLAHASPDALVYLDRRTGEFLAMTDETLLLGELDPDEIALRSEAERRAVRRLREAERDPDRYRVLPDPWAAEGSRPLARFAECVEDEALRGVLAHALREGRSGAGRVRDLIQRHGLEREWNAFEEVALVRMARHWLEDGGLPYRDDLEG